MDMEVYMTMCDGIIYDSSIIEKDDVIKDIEAKAKGAKVLFRDIEMTSGHYWMKFRSLEGWNKYIRYCNGEWEEN